MPFATMYRLRLAVGLIVLAILAVASVVGCTQGQVTAAKLPPEFMAPVNENMEAIDLSRLSHYATNSELIDRGDVLDVSIVTNYSTLATTTTPVRVADNGTADIPVIGPVSLVGLEVEGAEQAISAAAVSRGIFQKPHVTVTMRRQRTNRITVIGAVKTPGVYTLPRGSSSLLAALVAAGGLTDDGGPNVEIRQSGPAPGGPRPPGPQPAPLAIQVDLSKAASEGDRHYPVNDGDVVVVSRRAPKGIYVMGLVAKPGEYRLPPNQNLQVLDALALAGDRTSSLADSVVVIRHLPGREEPVLIGVSVREAKNHGSANLRLAPGDVVSVEDTPLTLVFRTFTEIVRFSVGGAVSVF